MAFYGYNRPGANISEGVPESFWLQSMMAGFPACYFCIKAFSETNLTEDLKQFDVSTLILHGDEDQIVPIADSALQSSKVDDDDSGYAAPLGCATLGADRAGRAAAAAWHTERGDGRQQTSYY